MQAEKKKKAVVGQIQHMVTHFNFCSKKTMGKTKFFSISILLILLKNTLFFPTVEV